MARTFTSAGSQLLDLGDIAIDGVSALTIAFWGKRTASNNLLAVGKSNSANVRTCISAYTDGRVYFLLTTGAAQTYGHVASNLTTWAHYCLVFDGSGAVNADRLKGYINGVNQTLTFVGTIPATSPNPSTFHVNRDPALPAYGNGSYAELGVWTEALSAENVAALADGVSPAMVCPSGILTYLPIMGRTSPEVDVFGNSPGTLTGTPTQSEHPPMRYPSRVQSWTYGAAAPATGKPYHYYQMMHRRAA